jgi:AcrR family transcriptional regulator
MTEPTGARRPGRPKRIDREHVIQTAMEAWWRDGTDAVSFNEVVRRSGASKPAVHREFGGEDGLMDAVLEHYASNLFLPALGNIIDDRPFAEVLADLIEFLIDTDRDFPPGCLHSKMRVLSSRLGPSTQARVDDVRDAARAIYTNWVERAKAAGEISATLSTDTAVAFLDAQSTALLIQAALGEDTKSLRAQAQLAFAGLLAGGEG